MAKRKRETARERADRLTARAREAQSTANKIERAERKELAEAIGSVVLKAVASKSSGPQITAYVRALCEQFGSITEQAVLSGWTPPAPDPDPATHQPENRPPPDAELRAILDSLELDPDPAE